MRGLHFITTCSQQTLLAALVMLSVSCEYNVQKQSGSPTQNQQEGLSADSVISYNLVANYSLQSCARCHSGSQSPTLNSITLLKTHIDDVLAEVEGGDMPPAGNAPVTACQQAILKKWVELNMPEESTSKVFDLAACKSGDTEPVTPPVVVVPIDLMPLNFETLKTQILQPKCLLCHNVKSSDSDSAEIPFETYADVVGVSGQYWTAPGNTSKAYEEVNYPEGDDGMPPLESKIDRLTDKEMDFIVRWIDAGRPEK